MNKIRFKLDPMTGRLSETDSKKYFSTVGLAVFAFIVGSYASSFGISFLLFKLSPSLLDNYWVQLALTMVCQYGVGLSLCLLALSRLPKDEPPSEKLGGGAFFKGFCVAYMFMWIGNLLGNNIAAVIGNMINRPLINPVVTMVEGNAWWATLVFSVLIVPVVEELVFRKLFCDRLLPLGEGYAVVISAVIFGLSHGNFFQFFYAFLTGLVFGAIYVKTGRIRYTVIYHTVVNALGTVIVPYLYGKIGYLLEAGKLESMLGALLKGDEAASSAAVAELTPYLGYLLVFSLISSALMAATVFGVVVFIKQIKRQRFTSGLLPPAKEGRVANVICNVGAAAAITAFVGVFILSLI